MQTDRTVDRNSDTTKKKDHIWKIIEAEVNAKNPDVRRSLENIKIKWKNLKIRAKEDLSNAKKSVSKTGSVQKLFLSKCIKLDSNRQASLRSQNHDKIMSNSLFNDTLNNNNMLINQTTDSVEDQSYMTFPTTF
uniref:Regulatory protein zeste n=1 Tax=Romanomermis culicivorax TaxID=13658 RepID=A0A915L0L2_ROMCU